MSGIEWKHYKERMRGGGKVVAHAKVETAEAAVWKNRTYIMADSLLWNKVRSGEGVEGG